ncbi:hypothetical protein ACJX0J_014791, partial [Zea mays]
SQRIGTIAEDEDVRGQTFRKIYLLTAMIMIQSRFKSKHAQIQEGQQSSGILPWNLIYMTWEGELPGKMRGLMQYIARSTLVSVLGSEFTDGGILFLSMVDVLLGQINKVLLPKERILLLRCLMGMLFLLSCWNVIKSDIMFTSQIGHH